MLCQTVSLLIAVRPWAGDVGGRPVNEYECRETFIAMAHTVIGNSTAVNLHSAKKSIECSILQIMVRVDADDAGVL